MKIGLNLNKPLKNKTTNIPQTLQSTRRHFLVKQLLPGLFFTGASIPIVVEKAMSTGTRPQSGTVISSVEITPTDSQSWEDICTNPLNHIQWLKDNKNFVYDSNQHTLAYGNYPDRDGCLIQAVQK
ncbi:MAG: hypothetical protein SFU25_07375 [Candidatus Caenarcaniphilales bacterium]|nr:hypothetical protein [Candidatus Caenarcaniphilales bacterium]